MMLRVSHCDGFFSGCNVYLNKVFSYFNREKKTPEIIDSTNAFTLYKPSSRINDDIKCEYFDTLEDIFIEYTHDICTTYEHDEDQFSNYSKINFDMIDPFIKKYFTPSLQIKNHIEDLEKKYNLDYENTCVLFYRGNDKCVETNLPSYDEFIQKANERKSKNPDIVFLIQSDETEFIETMLQHFPNSFVFKDEIRHMSKKVSSVDRQVSKDVNYVFSKLYLAITIIMSKCKYIISTTGNCSLWVILFRGHTNGFIQYLSRKKIIYDEVNIFYKETTTCWIE
jgi:hypothetical protein